MVFRIIYFNKHRLSRAVIHCFFEATSLSPALLCYAVDLTFDPAPEPHKRDFSGWKRAAKPGPDQGPWRLAKVEADQERSLAFDLCIIIFT